MEASATKDDSSLATCCGKHAEQNVWAGRVQGFITRAKPAVKVEMWVAFGLGIVISGNSLGVVGVFFFPQS